MLFHLITSLGAVEVVFVEASSSMLTAQAEKMKILYLPKIKIQVHHHDRLAEISPNLPSNLEKTYPRARNLGFRVGT